MIVGLITILLAFGLAAYVLIEPWLVARKLRQKKIGLAVLNEYSASPLMDAAEELIHQKDMQEYWDMIARWQAAYSDITKIEPPAISCAYCGHPHPEEADKCPNCYAPKREGAIGE